MRKCCVDCSRSRVAAGRMPAGRTSTQAHIANWPLRHADAPPLLLPPPLPPHRVSADQAQTLFHERHEGMEGHRQGDKTTASRRSTSTPPDVNSVRTPRHHRRLAGKSSSWFPPGTGQDV